MRLIDADDLYVRIAFLFAILADESIEKLYVLETIKEQTTVDTVKHGYWIIDRKFGADIMSGEQMVICSECDKEIFWGKQNYCPHCGARMDGEGE